MARFAAIAALCVLAVSVSSVSAESMTPLDFGMTMSVRAYDAVCWYVNLKVFPDTNTNGFMQCEGQAEFQKNAIETNDFFVQNPDMKEQYFGQWLNDQAMGGLPSVYGSKCGKYLQDSKAEPPADESDALNDGGNKYPYRGFAYCMMKTLRDTYGSGAIDAVKNERTHTRKNWMQALLDRDNEFRKRHGLEPFILAQPLNEAAQNWAQENANSCDMHHSTSDQRKFEGQDTGESLAAGQESDKDKEVSAYLASDGWYEEIKNYPFPDGYQGGDDSLFEKIGHFTQSVWKGSKYVGYGIAFNNDCKGNGGMTRYIAARYYPAGNMDGEFPSNVLPPQ